MFMILSAFDEFSKNFIIVFHPGEMANFRVSAVLNS